MNYTLAGALMTASNFLYQAVNNHDYMTAFERSWFSVSTLMTAWLLSYLINRDAVGGSGT